MMRLRYIAPFVGLIVCSAMFRSTAAAQTWVEVKPQEVSDAYYAAAAKYAVEREYYMGVEVASYRDLTDKEPHKLVACDIRKAGDLYRADHFGRVSYQDARMKVMVVPEQRTIVLGAGQEAFEMLGAEIQKEMFNKVVRATRSGDPREARYRVFLTQAYKWEYIEFAFTRDGWMQQLVLVMADLMAVDPGNPLTALVRPRVVFSFETPRPLDLPTDELSWTNVLSLNGATPKAIGAYAGYDVIDTRPR